jgi:hypothetical protein
LPELPKISSLQDKRVPLKQLSLVSRIIPYSLLAHVLPKTATTTTITIIAINPPFDRLKLEVSDPEAPAAFPDPPDDEGSPGPPPSPDCCCGVAVANEANTEETEAAAAISAGVEDDAAAGEVV